MKRFLIIMLAGIFFCNIVMAKEINTKFGFSIDLPDNYFAVQNENMDDVMKRLEEAVFQEFNYGSKKGEQDET